MKHAKVAPERADDVWTWTVLDSDSKMILLYLVGNRDAEYALAFLDGVRSRWRTGSNSPQTATSLHDGNTQISAMIADEAFLARVNANQIAFGKGDILVCNVQVTQKRRRDGLRTEYEVAQVLEHRLAARQLELNIEPPIAQNSN